ncbi:septum formation initiator family protein [Cohnella lubricantis]|uniref:Septum formation initiator family protein n=1 Tax=Cohnella lubricantis TaxID=2163172 RepID=A0A841TKJ5_9BACL|nr:septum formation initiator family protein [Cohnella lubricantis]MBB6679710.1 septum formation initiator family protein [Cohnella lubricantis]MBP2119368.1 cell division protein DivIC [Cohnella lubricantis]
MPTHTSAATPPSVGARRRLKLLLIVVVLFMGWAGYTLITQQHHTAERISQLSEVKSKLLDAQQKNQSLQEEIQRLNDPEYIGQIARKEQGMGLPGEMPIQVGK